MRYRTALFVCLLAATLPAYAFDCQEPMTPDQAMQCCKDMSCSSAGHEGQDCCKAVTAARSPFVQPATDHPVCKASVVLGVLPLFREPAVPNSSVPDVQAHWHSPPSISASRPLRI